MKPRILSRRRGQMKSAVLATAALLALTSCTTDSNQQDAATPTVFTTFTVLEDMAQNVAGEHLVVESLTKPGAEIHEYDPTPSDVAKAHKADLILHNGLGLEAWFEKFTQDTDAQTVVVSEGVQVLDIREGEATGTPNPHAWMSPENARIYVENIAEAFAELDPQNADDYRANAKAYSEELEAIGKELKERLSTLPQEHRALVTCEGAFSYLAHEVGLEEKYLWPVNSDAQVSAARMTEVSDFVRDQGVPAVFCESTVSDAMMQQVVSETSAVFGGRLYVDSLSEASGDVPSYLELLRYDAQVIAAGLTGEL